MSFLPSIKRFTLVLAINIAHAPAFSQSIELDVPPVVGLTAQEAMKALMNTPLDTCYWMAGVLGEMAQGEVVAVCRSSALMYSLCSGRPQKVLVLGWTEPNLTTAEMLRGAAATPVLSVRSQCQ